MTTKTKVLGILTLVALVAAFVAGYWPEHQARVAAEAESATLRSRVPGLEDQVRAAQLHSEMLNVIDAIEAMNYGQAQSLSTALFDRTRAEASRTQNPQFRAAFEAVLAQRDVVTAALAKGDAAAAAPLSEAERALRQLIGQATAEPPARN